MHVRDAVLYGYLEGASSSGFRHSSTWDGQPCTEMGFYGPVATGARAGSRAKASSSATPNAQTCFAVAAYRDGMRINRDGQ